MRRISRTLIGTSMTVALIMLAAPAWAGGPIRFVAIQADPPGVNDGSDASLNEEYVVLRNISDHAVSMGRYSIALGSKQYGFRDTFTLQAGSKVRVHTGKGTDARHDVYWGRTAYAYPNTGTYFVTLWGPAGTMTVEPKDQCMVSELGGINGPC